MRNWTAESERNRVFLENISEEKILKITSDYNEEAIWEKIQLGISTPALSEPEPSYRRRFLWKYAAAALVAIVLGAGTVLIWKNVNKEPDVKQIVSIYKNDVAPGRNKAVLTLASGSKIVLDTTDKGKIIEEGGAKISKTENGQLAYAINPATLALPKTELYNIVTTERGGQYQLLLADGSRVWLNAESSLRYPVYFTGKERIVELTGEAYFEVAKNAKAPFKVRVNGVDVNVLGTHFNIMAYRDERETRTTLLEGSVKVNNGSATSVLKPGQQLLVDEKGESKLIDNVNMDEVVAWQKGIFQFTNADIKTIMRQAARWYDIDIIFEGNVPDHFNATIPRNVSVSKLLGLLDLTGHVHFNVDGKKVTVLP